MDLFRVQGRWAAAARLAFIRCIHDSITSATGGSPLSKTAENHFPSYQYWLEWSAFFESLWIKNIDNVIQVVEKTSVPSQSYRYRINNHGEHVFINELIVSDSNRPNTSHWKPEELAAFVAMTVRGFLRMDLYNALTEFLTRAQGSFGIQMHCTLEEGVVVLASKGQPMSISCDPKLPICLFGSEAGAVAVSIGEKGRWLPLRLDLDSKGEVIRVGRERALIEGTFKNKLENGMMDGFSCLLLESSIEITSYSLTKCYEWSSSDLMSRMVRIPNATQLGDPDDDLVSKDLSDVPQVLTRINKAWQNDSSSEVLSANALVQNLIRCMESRLRKSNLDTVDLIIVGVEASLWVAEQFAADLRVGLPELVIDTVSANKVISACSESTENLRSVIPQKISPLTCVILVSQSGQTFPTLHATRLMTQLAGLKVWILSGCVNSRMENEVRESFRIRGQLYLEDRVFNNYSGHRPAEPTSVAIASTFHTFTWLLLHILRAVNARNEVEMATFRLHRGNLLKMDNAEPSLVPTLYSVHCINDMQSIVANSCVATLCDIVGYDELGTSLTKEKSLALTNRELVQQGKLWAAHVNEPWTITVAVGCYIFVSVGLDLPIFRLVRTGILTLLNQSGVNTTGTLAFGYQHFSVMLSQHVLWTLIGFITQILDALVFVYLAKIFTWIYRWATGRPMWARHGKRTVVIVDVPWVHQLVNQFVSKLFSQSYSFVSLDVHSANGLDHFVHRYTHRVVRGVLIAIGRPDGRLLGLAKSESAVILAGKQAAFIRNPLYKGESSGPEFVTIGHNPFKPAMGLANHISLNSGIRGKFADEILYEQMHSLPHTTSPAQSLRSISKYGCPSNNHKMPLSIYGMHFAETLLLTEQGDDDIEAQHNQKTSSQATVSSKLTIMQSPKSKQLNNRDDPAVRMAFSSRLDAATRDVETMTTKLHQFYEHRVASLERFVAFCVMFHSLAIHCNQPWFCNGWNIARSQSNLRVATTASPVSADQSSSQMTTTAVLRIARLLHSKLRGFDVKF
mmetsp:Transcript_26378/g.36255  ORF Transcript_26378/g.36255 Transcript_26378/m.36255 type:complete len:1022 (+) Transcript_26378:670-3735(+)